MPIAIPPRKPLVAKKLAAERPDLTPSQVGRLIGASGDFVAKAIAQQRFGRQKPKTRVPFNG